jgi:uncharacterized membrane protein YgaE (UPF0421/DUF939 family)
MKKFFQRIVKLFTDRRAWVRQVAVTGIAASIAWLLGDLLLHHGGVVCAIVCSLSIRISLYKSVREGFGQIVGTAIGAGVALLSIWIFHYSFFAIGATVVLCSVVARGLHLGEVASVNVPVTALIVIGPGLSESTAFNRLMSTLIGAAVAIAFSYFVHAKTPEGRTLDQMKSLAERSAKLLAQMSEGVAAGYSQEQAGKWLAMGRKLIEEIPAARSQALEAKAHAKWFPNAESGYAEELYTREVAIEHIVFQVRTIARTLFDSAVDGGLPASINRPIAAAISAASYALSMKAENMESNAAHGYDAEELRIAGQTLTEQLLAESEGTDHEQLGRAMSLITTFERIADSLDESSPALTFVATPDEPSSNKVLKVSPFEQTTRLSKRVAYPFKKIFGRKS